jgi:replicative DNA helicase
MTNRQPPYSQEAEEAVLGAVLTNPNTYLNIAAFLKPSDFFFVKHGYIWTAIGRLESKHEPIDTVTLSNELLIVNQLKDVGGPAYLTQLISNTPTSAHAEVYGNLVHRAAQRRELMKALMEAHERCYDETINVNELFGFAETRLLSVTVAEKKQSQTDIESIVHQYMDSLDNLREHGATPGLPTCYRDIDSIIGGSYKKEVTVIAGPAKSGKSSYNLNVARNRAKLGACVVIFITEMNQQAIIRKFISMETKIPISKLKDAVLNPQEYSRFAEASNRISKWKIHVIDDYTSLTPLDVRRELRRIMHNESVDSVLIDGLWMMKSNRAANARHEEISQVMVDLTEIAKKMDVRIDLVHQCSRAADGRRDPRPRLSDLGESSGVERNAYTIIFLYRENYYKHGDNASTETEVIVAANRDGNVGVAKLGFNKQSETYHTFDVAIPVVIAPPKTTDNRKDIYQ